MTTKPVLVGSLIALAMAILLGMVSARLWPRPGQASALRKEAKLSERWGLSGI